MGTTGNNVPGPVEQTTSLNRPMLYNLSRALVIPAALCAKYVQIILMRAFSNQLYLVCYLETLE